MKTSPLLRIFVLVFLLAGAGVFFYHDGTSLPMGAVVGGLHSHVVNVSQSFDAENTFAFEIDAGHLLRTVKLFGQWTGAGSVRVVLESASGEFVVLDNSTVAGVVVSQDDGIVALTGNVVLDSSASDANAGESNVSQNDSTVMVDESTSEQNLTTGRNDSDVLNQTGSDVLLSNETTLSNQTIEDVQSTISDNRTAVLNDTSQERQTNQSSQTNLTNSTDTASNESSQVTEDGSQELTEEVAVEFRGVCEDTCSMVPSLEGPFVLRIEVEDGQLVIDNLVIVDEEVSDEQEEFLYVRSQDGELVPSTAYYRTDDEWVATDFIARGRQDLRFDVDYGAVESIILRDVLISASDELLISRIGALKIANDSRGVVISPLVLFDAIDVSLKSARYTICAEDDSITNCGGSGGNRSGTVVSYGYASDVLIAPRDSDNRTVPEQQKDKQDPNFDLVIESAVYNGSDFVVLMHHDYDQTLPLRVKGRINYSLSSDTMGAGQTVELRVLDYDGSTPFQVKLGSQSEIISFGQVKTARINSAIKGRGGKSVSVSPQFYDVELEESASLQGGKVDQGKYRVTLPINSNKIKTIEMYNVSLYEDKDALIKVDEDLSASDFPEIDATNFFAIDPTVANFAEANVTITAVGTELHKCTEYDFETKDCYGEWVLWKTDLIPGQDYTFTIDPVDPVFAQTVSSCVAHDEAAEDSFGGVCDVPSGARLRLNDGLTETHTYSKSTYAGIRIQSVNTSITGCQSITSVRLCYEWWRSGTRAGADCSIRVDANGGASYSTVTTTCPGNTANPGVTCTAVTGLETWTCANFFGASGTRASADSQMRRTTAGPDSVETSTWDVFYFNVTYVMANPQVIRHRPIQNQTFNVSMPIQIAANVTAGAPIASVKAKIDYPLGGTENITLVFSGQGAKYNASYTVPAQVGRYNVTYIARDGVGLVNGSVKTYFNAVDLSPPQVLNPIPAENTSFAFNELIEIGADIIDSAIDTVLANVTLPNGSVNQLTLNFASGDKYNASYQLGLLGGRYNVSFFANDSDSFVNDSVTTYFNVITDNNPPSVFDVLPLNNSNYTVAESVVIKANVTDEVTITSVVANVTRPDMSVVQVSMSNIGGNTYAGNFLMTQVGAYEARIVAKDAAGNENSSETTQFYAGPKDLTIRAPIPDAAAPGMQVEVQFIGEGFSSTETITTTSPDIIVGPVIATDDSGQVVSTNASVLSTVFHIKESASGGSVFVNISGSMVQQPFQIVSPATGSGNFSGDSGVVVIGNGVDGTRTIGGTIVLDSLIVPAGVVLTIDTSDPDGNASNGNQGLLPAKVIVDGPVDIVGTINISGHAGYDYDDGTSPQAGGAGGVGGAGGGAGGIKSGGNGALGGDGFAGGGGSAGQGGAGAAGGIGSGAAGTAAVGANGGSGGASWYGDGLNGGQGGSDDGSAGGGGGGGSGYPFGSGGESNAAGEGPPSGGVGGGGAGGVNGEGEAGGGGGYATAGTNAINGDAEPGGGGATYGSSQLVPLMGGSGGGGGSPDTGTGQENPAGGGGGGAGALILYANGVVNVSGSLLATGGDGGIGEPFTGGGGGGGGSGGAFIIQANNMTFSPSTLSVSGGSGADGSGATGGDGGEGRVRVDGLKGTDIPGSFTSEFIGPSITGFNETHVIGRAAPGSDISIDIRNENDTASFTGTADGSGDYYIPVTYITGPNYITAIQNTGASISVLSSAATAYNEIFVSVFDPRPVENLTVQPYTSVEIAVNVTSNAPIDTVRAIIDAPNGSMVILPLNLTTGNKYNASYSLNDPVGYFNVTFEANATSGTLNDSVTTFFFVPFVPIVSFTLTLPGQPATNASINSTATAVMFFNSSVQTFADMEPCVKGTTVCQNSSLPFFQYLNLGNVNLTFSIGLDSDLPSVLALQSNNVPVPGSALEVNSTQRVIGVDIGPLETLDQWFYGDFINAYPSDSTSRNLTSNGTYTPTP